MQEAPIRMRIDLNAFEGPISKCKQNLRGIPGWRSGLAPAFGPGRDPGDPGSNPTSGSRCMEPASPSACVSASLSLSLCDYHKKNKIFKKKVLKKKKELEELLQPFGSTPRPTLKTKLKPTSGSKSLLCSVGYTWTQAQACK